MGLLDDAIRQHLELKRRHGADASAVAKLEHEAFGPVERGEALVLDDDVASEATHATAHEEELAYEEAELEAEEDWRQTHPPVASEPAAVAPVPPEPASEPLRPGGSVRLDDVGERSVAPGPEAQPDGEHDELEETPEFLQETPEHDRLWFEQKPPRDFDF